MTMHWNEMLEIVDHDRMVRQIVKFFSVGCFAVSKILHTEIANFTATKIGMATTFGEFSTASRCASRFLRLQFRMTTD
jgi:hypothetical protein